MTLTEDVSALDQPYSIQDNCQTPTITSCTTAALPQLKTIYLSSPNLCAIKDNPDRQYEGKLNVAIEASLSPDMGLPKSSQPKFVSEEFQIKCKV
ncbi:hypothetical protein O181_132877 [Austropuccinia psidii MF-1]|uniref:Uncharacterized protein n=1 Tax=Austropuccinia psidii MF-1 TaxID=1389203 RepID=A0A9Q3L7W0_9BASI|nr:hypothetical protein [Austropuccinia psidii MF-1]